MSATATHVTVRVPLTIRRRPGRKTVVTPVVRDGQAAVPTRADPALLKALARAFRYQRPLDEGRYGSISEMAAAERIERGYLGSLLRLTLLAPEIVEYLLEGGDNPSLNLVALMRPFPLAWSTHTTNITLAATNPDSTIVRSPYEPTAARGTSRVGPFQLGD